MGDKDQNNPGQYSGEWGSRQGDAVRSSADRNLKYPATPSSSTFSRPAGSLPPVSHDVISGLVPTQDRSEIEAVPASQAAAMPDNISHMRLSGVVPDANARAALDQVRSLRDRLQAVSVGGHVDANAMRRALQSLDDAEATVVQGGNGVATALAQVAAMAQTLEARSQAPSAAAILGAREQTQAVGNELFERRVLDPYLSFASEEDEAAYRAREEKRHRAIDVELAKHSSEGDFHAALLTREQLRDAGAHGATSSPDYNRLIVDEERAVDAAKAAVVRDHGNPDGIEASVRSQEEALRNSPNADDRAAAMGRDAAGVSATELAAITAAMQGAGIAVTPTNTSGHGVTVAAKQAGASTGRLVT